MNPNFQIQKTIKDLAKEFRRHFISAIAGGALTAIVLGGTWAWRTGGDIYNLPAKVEAQNIIITELQESNDELRQMVNDLISNDRIQLAILKVLEKNIEILINKI